MKNPTPLGFEMKTMFMRQRLRVSLHYMADGYVFGQLSDTLKFLCQNLNKDFFADV